MTCSSNQCVNFTRPHVTIGAAGYPFLAWLTVESFACRQVAASTAPRPCQAVRQSQLRAGTCAASSEDCISGDCLSVGTAYFTSRESASSSALRASCRGAASAAGARDSASRNTAARVSRRRCSARHLRLATYTAHRASQRRTLRCFACRAATHHTFGMPRNAVGNMAKETTPAGPALHLRWCAPRDTSSSWRGRADKGWGNSTAPCRPGAARTNRRRRPCPRQRPARIAASRAAPPVPRRRWPA